VPEADIVAISAHQKTLGFNGRVNRVRDDVTKGEALGRFGWKANQPSLAQQISAAYASDLGVTSSLYPDMNCPPVQVDCAAQPPGNQPEPIDSDWQEIIFWEHALALLARRNVTDPRFDRGERLFAAAQCAVCHVPELVTAREVRHLPAAANQKVRAYTDLLLHDMGDALADGRPDFRAGPRDWRTPPLWALGLSQTVSGRTAMLHDGRARNATVCSSSSIRSRSPPDLSESAGGIERSSRSKYHRCDSGRTDRPSPVSAPGPACPSRVNRRPPSPPCPNVPTSTRSSFAARARTICAI
jgi:CxxC motif-containing protein (DUF1111 family)